MSLEKQFLLTGLDCADCAESIERGIRKMERIDFASVNFMTGRLIVRTCDGYEGELTDEIEKIVHKIEPDVTVEESAAPTQKKGESGSVWRELTPIAISAALMAAGYLYRGHPLVTLLLFLTAYIVAGGEILWKALGNIIKGRLFDENFLMSVATLGALAIAKYPEAVAVMLFYRVGEFFQNRAVEKSRRSIADLMDIRPDYANLVSGDDVRKVSPQTVAVGDQILVRPGEKIPLDGQIVEGTSTVDTAALTGESLPREVAEGDTVLSGFINQGGVLKIRVEKEFGQSAVAKILDLVQNASSKKAPTENFITKFSRTYTPAVVGLAAMIILLPPLFWGQDWSEWINRGLVFLVISCPCALVVSIPLGFFGGLGSASRRGVLIKGGHYLEALNQVDTVVFDKTGTLTVGNFTVRKVLRQEGWTEEQVLRYAAYGESYSNHPVAAAIRKAYGRATEENLLADYQEISGQGVSVRVEGHPVLVGNGKLMDAHEIACAEPDEIGTKVFVSVDGKNAGCIVVADEMKADSREAIDSLKRAGVNRIVMLTGDSDRVGRAVADTLGIGEVHTELLPDQKVERMESIKAEKVTAGSLIFVGDGINDAPVLAAADVGVAMGGLGSDAAIEAADVVLMNDRPTQLVQAITIARKTGRIVWQNIIFALGVKFIILLLGAMGLTGMWEAVFADVGVSLLAVLNSLRANSAR